MSCHVEVAVCSVMSGIDREDRSAWHVEISSDLERQLPRHDIVMSFESSRVELDRLFPQVKS